MYIGAKTYIGLERKIFDPINGFSKEEIPVRRAGIGALGRYQPQDIGKRVYGNQVENDDQVERRTGMTFEQRVAEGNRLIDAARKKYAGQKNIWALTIRPRPNS